MTYRELERNCLSLRVWLQRCVLPSAVTLLIVLGLFRWISADPSNLDHNAVIVGFFTLYFVLVRGGHLLMIRSLHKDLKKTYGPRYEARLARVPIQSMRRRNLGFTLAKIKRELIDKKS